MSLQAPQRRNNADNNEETLERLRLEVVGMHQNRQETQPAAEAKQGVAGGGVGGSESNEQAGAPAVHLQRSCFAFIEATIVHHLLTNHSVNAPASSVAALLSANCCSAATLRTHPDGDCDGCSGRRASERRGHLAAGTVPQERRRQDSEGRQRSDAP